MAIEYPDLRKLLHLLKSNPELIDGKLLILGDAFIPVSPVVYNELAKELNVSLKFIPQHLNPYTLGESLGFLSTDTLDINNNASLNLDMSIFIDKSYYNRFNLIIDAGVLFWCFNPGIGLMNVYNMLKVDGYVMHITGVSGFYGRAYYNMHPKLFEDFYERNGAQHWLSTYRYRELNNSLFVRITNRIFKFFGIIPARNELVTYNNSGHVYFSGYHHGSCLFSTTHSLNYVPTLPNDIIGILIFKKYVSQHAVQPHLISDCH